jgi:hypothetical protein
MDYVVGSYSFRPAIDLINEEVTVLIYFEKEQMTCRKFDFKDKTALSHIKNFCNKFATDEEYRKQYLQGGK